MTTLYKVTDKDGRGCNGGKFAYPLPKGKRPGAWTPPAAPKLCSSGYHLTSRPEAWWSNAEPRRLFVAEGRGATAIEVGDKAAFESVRLVAEVTPEWPLLPLYPLFRALLMSSWRIENGADAQWPEWASLDGANLRGAYLRGAYLYGASLDGANLDGANLRGANLRGAYLYGASLYGASLDGANLYGANLRGAYLYGASLYGASLDGANLRGASRPDWLPKAYTVDRDGIVVMAETTV